MMPPRAAGGRVHKDKAQDEALIKKTLRDEGLVRRADGGPVGSMGEGGPGLKVPKMDAGALTGEGRLEKIDKKPKSAGRPQAV